MEIHFIMWLKLMATVKEAAVLNSSGQKVP